MSIIAIRDINEIKKLDRTRMDRIHGGHGSCSGGSGAENQNPDGIMFAEPQQQALVMGVSSQPGDLITTPIPGGIPSSSGRAGSVLKGPPRCPGEWLTI